MSNKFIKTADASNMLEPYLSVITKGSCSHDEDGLFLVKDFDPHMSYVASPISGKSLVIYIYYKCMGNKYNAPLMGYPQAFDKFSFHTPF